MDSKDKSPDTAPQKVEKPEEAEKARDKGAVKHTEKKAAASATSAKKKDEEIKELKDKLAQLEKDKAKAESDFAASKDSHLRTLAEYDNFRRRTAKEKDELYRSSKIDVIKALLPAIDNLERAAASDGSDPAQYQKGIEMTARQLMEAVTALGVESFGEKGDKFDPMIHEALMHEDYDSLPPDTVSFVFEKGYRIGDKLIRAARVKTAN